MGKAHWVLQCTIKHSLTFIIFIVSKKISTLKFLPSADAQTAGWPAWCFIIINPITTRVVGAPQMILQPVSYIFPFSPLPSRICRTPGLPFLSCCLSTSSPVCLVLFLLSLYLARWFWTDLMNGIHEHTTAVCVSLRPSGGLRVSNCLLDLCTDFFVGNVVFVWDV